MILFRKQARFSGLVALWLAVLALGCRPVAAQAADLGLEVRLIWGTNDPESPNPAHKHIDTPLTRKLAKLFTWKHYFEVNLQEALIPLNGTRKIALSEQCTIEVTNLGANRVDVKLLGRGKPVSKTVETLPQGDWLVLAGDSEGKTAWFVVLKTKPS